MWRGLMNSQFWVGVVEDRADPLYIGRCRVRVFGVHTPDIFKLPTEDLPWATPVGPITSAAMTGIGQTHVGPVEGTLVVGFFLDAPDTQMPAFLGTIAGVPQDPTKMLEIQDFEFSSASNTVDRLQISSEKADLEPGYITTKDPLPLERKRDIQVELPSNSPYQMKLTQEGFDLLTTSLPFYTYPTLVDGKWYFGYSELKNYTPPEPAGPSFGPGPGPTEPNIPQASRNTENVKLLAKVRGVVEPIVREVIKADITQSMYDTVVILAVKEGIA